MRVRRSGVRSLLAVGCLAASGCQLIAYGDDDGADSGTGASAGASTSASAVTATNASSSTGLMGVCPAPTGTPDLRCSDECGTFCSSYEADCPLNDPTNAFGSRAGCCASCDSFGAGSPTSGNNLICRAAVLNVETDSKCEDAGPYSATCGGPATNARPFFALVCGHTTSSNVDAQQRTQLLAAAQLAYFGCTDAASCVCAAIDAEAGLESCQPAIDDCRQACSTF